MSGITAENYARRAAVARRDGRLGDARSDAQEAVALCRAGNDPQKLARALMLSGQIEKDLGNRAESLVLCEEAADLSRSADEPLRFAHTIRHLADLYVDCGVFELAETCYQEALDIYRSDDNARPGDVANAIRGFAVLKDAVGADEEAAFLWEEARDLYASLGVKEGVEECNARLGK